MTTTPFTAASTHAVMRTACREVGLNSEGAEMARLGENAMYRLASAPVMVRIGRSVEAGRKEARIAQWLASHQFPAVRLAGVEQPLVFDDLVVTFWEFIEESEPTVAGGELGDVLRRLHTIPEPSDLSLPFFSPMPKVEQRLSNIGSLLAEEDYTFLKQRRQELEEQFAKLDFDLGFGPVHGDYHKANLMRDRSGAVKLIDFEDFCWGPREWDVCVYAVRFHAMRWETEDEYAAYVSAYGFDPLNWPGFPVVRAVRELNMTTWLAQQLGQSAEIDAEVRQRIADLRDDQAPRNWRIF